MFNLFQKRLNELVSAPREVIGKKLEAITGLPYGSAGSLKPWLEISCEKEFLEGLADNMISRLFDELPVVVKLELQPMSDDEDDHCDIAEFYLYDFAKFLLRFDEGEGIRAILQDLENGADRLPVRIYQDGLKTLRERLEKGRYEKVGSDEVSHEP